MPRGAVGVALARGLCLPALRGNPSQHLHPNGRQHWQCRVCRYQTTVTAGTIFQATKLPLTRWFLAMHLLTQAKNNVAALELMRHLDVSYKTAWLMKLKLLQVMTERESSRVLEGRVEIDDAYLGGERPGRRGRGSGNKVSFVATVQTTEDGKPVVACFVRIPFTKQAIEAWAKKARAPAAQVLSDGLGCVRGVTASGATHSAIIMNGGTGRESAQHPAFRAVNTVLGNLKTAISGTYHAFDFRNTQTVTWPRFRTVLTAASILAPYSSASFALRRLQPHALKLPFALLRHVINQVFFATNIITTHQDS